MARVIAAAARHRWHSDRADGRRCDLICSDDRRGGGEGRATARRRGRSGGRVRRPRPAGRLASVDAALTSCTASPPTHARRARRFQPARGPPRSRRCSPTSRSSCCPPRPTGATWRHAWPPCCTGRCYAGATAVSAAARRPGPQRRPRTALGSPGRAVRRHAATRRARRRGRPDSTAADRDVKAVVAHRTDERRCRRPRRAAARPGHDRPGRGAAHRRRWRRSRRPRTHATARRRRHCSSAPASAPPVLSPTAAGRRTSARSAPPAWW